MAKTSKRSHHATKALPLSLEERLVVALYRSADPIAKGLAAIGLWDAGLNSGAFSETAKRLLPRNTGANELATFRNQAMERILHPKGGR